MNRTEPKNNALICVSNEQLIVFFLFLLFYRGDIEEMQKHEREIRRPTYKIYLIHARNPDFTVSPKYHIIVFPKAKYYLAIPVKNELSTCTLAVFKTTLWILSQYRTCCSAKKLKKLILNLDAKDLMETGVYKNMRDASHGIHNAIHILSHMMIGSLSSDEANALEKDASLADSLGTHCSIFDQSNPAKIRAGMIKVPLNPDFPVNLMIKPYTILPMQIFILPKHACHLLYYIFYLARQNDSEIAEGKSFKLGLKTIATRLALPLTSKTKNPTRDIKNVIITAMEQINAILKSEGIALQIDEMNIKNTERFLHKNNLLILLSGKYHEYFAQLTASKAMRSKASIANTKAKSVNPQENSKKTASGPETNPTAAAEENANAPPQETHSHNYIIN